MITWTCIEFEGRHLVVRKTSEGVSTVECDCLTRRSAQKERHRLILAAEKALRRRDNVIAIEAVRNVERGRWVGNKQGQLL